MAGPNTYSELRTRIVDPVEVIRQLRSMGALEVKIGDIHVVFSPPAAEMVKPPRETVMSQEERYIAEAIRSVA